MSPANRLSAIIGKLDLLPRPVRSPVLSLLLGRMVPFVGTAGVRIEEMTEQRVSVVVENQRRNRNHIGQVHAAAMALAAETATGFVTGMNVPDSKMLLCKSLKVDFKKRTTGSIRAVATLTEDQRARIRSEERGDVTVEVHATDETGIEPIQCELVWAWIPRQRS
jgi:uncharacterized protein (TIGR00369 family)